MQAAEQAATLSGLAAGEALRELQRGMGYPAWRTWVARECPIAQDTARKYVRAAKEAEKSYREPDYLGDDEADDDEEIEIAVAAVVRGGTTTSPSH